MLGRAASLDDRFALIAETFYEFHSFILEAWAFFATWYALDAVLVAWRDRKRR